MELKSLKYTWIGYPNKTGVEALLLYKYNEQRLFFRLNRRDTGIYMTAEGYFVV